MDLVSLMIDFFYLVLNDHVNGMDMCRRWVEFRQEFKPVLSLTLPDIPNVFQISMALLNPVIYNVDEAGRQSLKITLSRNKLT